jgi:hypothetical protein
MTSVPQPDACKKCSKCLQDKPLTDYYIDRRDMRHYARCKVCHNAQTMERYIPAVKRERVEPDHRICTGCKQDLAITHFPPKGGKRQGARPRCFACHRADNAAYRVSHREEIRAASRAYYAANPTACNARTLAAIAANPERYKANNRAWKAANKDAVNASTNKRRARIKGNGGQWTAAEWQAIKVAQDFHCLMCGRREPDIKLCFDHIVPVSLGGPNTAVNGQGLCRSCNSKKHRRVLDLRKDT